MKKRILVCAMSALLLAISSRADDKEKDEDRLKNAGTVLTEILNIPDDIPQDLLDKADCVVVFPSVLKAAFAVGGSKISGSRASQGTVPHPYRLAVSGHIAEDV